MKLIPIGGLGNRLRAILSTRAAHGPIEVLWANSDAVCHGGFLDVFEPLEGVSFTYSGEGNAHDLKVPHDIMTCGVDPKAPSGWCAAYRELRPRRDVQERIDRRKRSIGGPYRAIHARRTDHVEHAVNHGHFTSNQELLAWVGDYAGPLYVATDDPDTLNFFLHRLPGRVFFDVVPEAVRGYEKRPGHLEDVVVDLYMCAGAEDFYGSWFSSFSETVRILASPPEHFDERRDMPSTDPGRRWP